jgi:MFS family permease
MSGPQQEGQTVSNVSSATPISRSMLLPLALAQFIASYAASNMNVAISSIASDLKTSVHGVQVAITLFTLTMAALMIPGSKLTDIWGRKRCFIIGLSVYGLGALVAALTPHLGGMIVGYSLMEGIGSALMIPPIYILITVACVDLTARAKSFGIISASAGVGAAAGPLIGGVITSALSWRASFLLQVVVVASIIVLSRKIADPAFRGNKPPFDGVGAILSAAGLFFVVLGIVQSGSFGWIVASQDVTVGEVVLIPQGGISPVLVFVGIGVVILLGFFLHIRSREHAGKEPLLSTRLFHNRISNLGLVTQNIQWLILQGSFFVISVFLQTIREFTAIQTGLLLTPATIGILLSSGIAERLAKRHAQRTLIIAGFVTTIAGISLLLLFARATSNIFSFIPGLFCMGVGIGVMLTSSVNVVQSSFPEQDQGEISGLSRCVSNLGSSLGTAIVGSVLVTSRFPGNLNYALALVVMGIIACLGLIAALLLPANQRSAT